MTMTKEEIARFWSHVAIGKPDDCWIWMAGKCHWGYGKVGIQGRTLSTHRVSYELANGPIPKGEQVLHDCDIPPCVNPAHLFLGSQQDNIDDCIGKGRFNPASGERHGRARMTVEDIRWIRSMQGVISNSEIARRHKVSSQCIDKIMQRRTWKHC